MLRGAASVVQIHIRYSTWHVDLRWGRSASSLNKLDIDHVRAVIPGSGTRQTPEVLHKTRRTRLMLEVRAVTPSGAVAIGPPVEKVLQVDLTID